MPQYFGWILLLLTVIFIFAYKKRTKNPDAVTSKFEAQDVLIAINEKNLDLIEEALKKSGFKDVRHYESKHKFYAQTKFSMSSFSELIEVKYSLNDSSTMLDFKSICAFPLQVFDWGKNQRNYKKFNLNLKELLQ